MKKIKCLSCWNDIYMDNCSVSCPNCGYTDNWDVPQSYQLDKEKYYGKNMPKVQLQHIGGDESEEKKSPEEKDGENRCYEKISNNKAW